MGGLQASPAGTASGKRIDSPPFSGNSMTELWNILRERALFVSFAGDAFHFEISWLGVILVIAAMVIWRRLRR